MISLTVVFLKIHYKKILLSFLITLVAFPFSSAIAKNTSDNGIIYLVKVKAFAETMLEFGWDDERYGTNTSPMFAVFLPRETNQLPDFPYSILLKFFLRYIW